MKTIRDYVVQQLNELVSEFIDIQASYRYDHLCETFYVKILPSVTFKEDDSLTCKRADILDNFLDVYPDESIVFLTEGSSIKMELIEYFVEGDNYNCVEILSKTKKLLANYKNFEFTIEGMPDAIAMPDGDTYALAA